MGPSAWSYRRRWRGDARLSSCWQKAAAPLPGGALARGVALLTSTRDTSAPTHSGPWPITERTMDQGDHGKMGRAEIRVTAVMPLRLGSNPSHQDDSREDVRGNGLALQDLRPPSLTCLCSGSHAVCSHDPH